MPAVHGARILATAHFHDRECQSGNGQPLWPVAGDIAARMPGATLTVHENINRVKDVRFKKSEKPGLGIIH